MFGKAIKSIGLVSAMLFSVALTKVDAAEPDQPEEARPRTESSKSLRTLGIVLYPGFELLDVYGPAEVFGTQKGRLKLVMLAAEAGPVTSSQGPRVLADCSLRDAPELDLILVPGGIGTLTELRNQALLEWLRTRGERAEIVMSVCTGSGLLARAGLLDGRRATTNKRNFQLIVGSGPKVEWVESARWVDEGNRVTSSGVTAGIDMALHVLSRLYGEEAAVAVAEGIEHQWHRQADVDPFSRQSRSTSNLNQ